MKVYIHTYGCQMNERDSEAVGALLGGCGCELAGSEAEADAVIVNTCSVRAKAEAKALGKLGLLVASKRERPGRLVGAMGCMVQRMGASLFEKVAGLDFAVGTHELSRLPEILLDCGAGTGTGGLHIGGLEPDPGRLSGHECGGVSAFVTVLQGCDRRCSYCVVPAVRGSARSRPACEVVDEVRLLAVDGVKEVVLLGQSVTDYGRANEAWGDGVGSPLGLREPFPRLLEAVAKVEGLERVRFASSHPSGCTAELLRVMTGLPVLCEHLHLPVQSGSDRILGLMGRGYTAAEYLDAVRRFRAAMPGLGITTDVIVGYPSETVAEFEMTRGLMDAAGFDNAFIFKYSPRPDTRAAAAADDVPDAEKARRNGVLLADQDRRGLALNERLIGREVAVLVEGRSLRNVERLSGRTSSNKIVVFEAAEGIVPGVVVAVAVERATAQTLYGRPTGVIGRGIGVS